MKFLLDMNLSPLWKLTLEDAGFETIHWSEIGHANAPDTEIMSLARERSYVVLTQDLDFGLSLAATGEAKPSVLQIRAQDVLPNAIGKEVVEALRQTATELTEGALVTVDPRKTRIRSLPLHFRPKLFP